MSKYLISEQLNMPIPRMDIQRQRKKSGYGNIPIDNTSPLFKEPIVNIHEYGIAGQNYYSRPNATVSEPLPGVSVVPELRKSVAERLGKINGLLRNLAVTAFFGAEVELYVEDGLRTTTVQKRLFEIEVPQLLARNDPNLSDADVDARKRQLIAAPSTDPSRPSPHSTGGAVDVILRYRQDSQLFVPDTNVWIGHTDGDTASNIDPDHYEGLDSRMQRDQLALNNRRAFYAIMTGNAFDIDTELKVNPTEIWHWSNGDQLWAQLSESPTAFYGPVQ